MHSKRLSNRFICLSIEKYIENTNNQLKNDVIRSEKGTITMFGLFVEGHSAGTTTYDFWELQTQSFLIS